MPFKEYYEARDVYRALKPQYKATVRNVKRLEKRHDPYVQKEKFVLHLRGMSVANRAFAGPWRQS